MFNRPYSRASKDQNPPEATFNQKTLPQNLLFLGPSGVGKWKMAYAVAQKLLCETSNGCGICGPCLRVAHQQSESLCSIQPEKNVIKIEAIRNMIQFLHLQALGKAKVVIVRDAQCLNMQATNALLKTLEDPPQSLASRIKTYFIFVTSHRGSLMPTLNSRLQSISFTPLSNEDLKQIKKGKDISEWMLRSCQGRVDLLENLMEKVHLRKIALEIFGEMFQPTVSSAFLKIKQHKQSDQKDTLWLTAYMGQFLRDVMFLKLGREDVMHVDLIPYFKRVLGLPYHTLFDLFAFVIQMTDSIEGYVDKTLLFEEFIFKGQS